MIVITVLNSLALLVPALAQEGEEVCSWESAQHVSISQVWELTEKRDGHCIRIKGLLSYGRDLYADRAAVYQVERIGSPYVDHEGKTDDLTLTTYLSDMSREALYQEASVHKGELLAWTARCSHQSAAEREAAAGEKYVSLVYFLWPCHWGRDSAYLYVIDARLKPFRFERLTGQRAARQYGNLVRVQTGDRLVHTAMAVAREAFSLLQASDGKTLAAKSENFDWDGTSLTVSNSPVRSIDRFRALQSMGPLILFEQVPYPTATQSGPHAFDGVACQCVERRCRGRWPISTLDAVNTDDRPYVCLFIEMSWYEDGLFSTVSIPVHARDRVEP